MGYKDSLFFSLSDVVSCLQKNKSKLLIFSFLLGILFFSYKLTRPIHYSAVAVFKTSWKAPTTTFSQAFESLSGSKVDTYIQQEDPLGFICSFPVLNQVISTLHLQGEIFEASRPGIFKKIYDNIRLERALFIYKVKKRPQSTLLTKKEIVPDRTHFEKHPPALYFKELNYSPEFAISLTITFLNETTYKVFDSKKQSLGEGSLNVPFYWPHGSFVIDKTNAMLNRKTFILSFLPAKEVALALQKTISVKKDKENRNLLKLTFNHSSRDLATTILNTIMDEYRKFLRWEGKAKIDQQLKFLEQRQQALMKEIDDCLHQHKIFLEDNLHEGGFLLLEKEINHLCQLQSEYASTLNHLSSELLLYKPEAVSFIDFLETLSKRDYSNIVEYQELNLDNAKERLAHYQKECDSLHTQEMLCHHYLNKLDDKDLGIEAFTSLINDPAFVGVVEKAHQLRLHLVDKRNWTPQERIRHQEDLETLKTYFKENFAALKESYHLQQEGLQRKISALKIHIEFLLYEDYKSTQKAFAILNQTLLKYPTKWIQEEELSLKTGIHKGIITSLCEVIEAKNITYNTTHIDSYPFIPAHTPSLPQPPSLILFFCVGATCGFCLGSVFLLAYEFSRGPLASSGNLNEMGYRVLGTLQRTLPKSLSLLHVQERSLLQNVLFEMLKENSTSRSLIIAAKHTESLNLIAPFLELLSYRKEKVLCIDERMQGEGLLDYLQGNLPNLPIVSHSYNDGLPLGRSTPLWDVLIDTPRCQELLNSLKASYNWIIFSLQTDNQSYLFKALKKSSDASIYMITDERLQDIESLETWYLIHHRKHQEVATKQESGVKHLRDIVPLLEKLKQKIASMIKKTA